MNSSIRDEFSKVVDVRIPPNGYRKYVKELSRTGAFAGLQHENTLLILLEAVDELQQQVEGLRIPRPEDKPVEVPLSSDVHLCNTCGKEFKSKIGLIGHSRSHEKRPVSPTTTK